VRRTTATTRATPAAELSSFHFFAGKGGVGKTTCAAAAALAAASGGARVLLVSTDPAHSLRDALEESPDGRSGTWTSPRRLPLIRARGTLAALELDADAALTRWIAERRPALARIVGRGTYLDEDDIDSILRLSFPGVDELIGLWELDRLAASGSFDLVVVDTAPTGHTLRLLAMPATLSRIAVVLDDMQAKHRVLFETLGGRYRPDAADELVDEVAAAGRGLASMLRDSGRVRVSWVLLAEGLSVAEARDGIAALETSDIRVDELIVNRMTPRPPRPCALCDGRRIAEARAMCLAREELGQRPMRLVPMLDREPRGVSALRALAPRVAGAAGTGARSDSAIARSSSDVAGARAPRVSRRSVRTKASVVEERWRSMVAPSGRVLVLFAGKGGVGKTTCAAATALAVAARADAPRVLLLSTDPAHSLGDVLDVEVGDTPTPVRGAPPSLCAREIDAASLFAARRRRYLETVDAVFDALRGGSAFDPAYDRAVVEDLIDLAPPGLDELLGILSITDALGLDGRAAAHDVAIVDTAPTGHALRLLAMPEVALEWVHAFMTILLKYRAVMGLGELGQDLVTLARELRTLRALLTDRQRATVVAVTRPAELPRRETRRLIGGLRALEIDVSAVVVNAVTGEGCGRCRRVAAAEKRTLATMRADMTSRGFTAEHGRRRASGGRRGPYGRVRATLAPHESDRAMILAPAIAPPPRGPADLTAWLRAWTVDEP